ncbi:DgyrCDS3287 [Dimorphilus gyrociliatus]|uniref:DgyrCDS3287 n=1 Tax=Dimorphilus gyrociliatus TaxID=2664684 RepID=A0A7I8VCS1_9ANNE|nr:DgyrCDS3287 [Dimorphilus gyrociliatus]
MAPINFYYVTPSAPCRAVIFTAKALGVELNMKYLSLFKGHHKTESFAKLNPHQTVPTIVDDGFILWESRAIQKFLFNKYANDEMDAIYPKDVRKRAVVDRYLFFDATVVQPPIRAVLRAMKFGKRNPTETEKMKLFDTLDKVNELCFKDDELFLNGDQATLADFAMAASITTLLLLDFNLSRWQGIEKYVRNLMETEWYNSQGDDFDNAIRDWTEEFKERGLCAN